MVFRAFFSCRWVVDVSILFRPVHHLLRVERTSEKGGGNLTDKIQNQIHIRYRYTPLHQKHKSYSTALHLYCIIKIDTGKIS